MSAERTHVLISADDLLEHVRQAYIAGCNAVQQNYRPLREGEDPEFGEASYDYVASRDFTETTRPSRERPALYSVALHFVPGELKVAEAAHNLNAEQAREIITRNRLREEIQVVKSQTIFIGPAHTFDLDALV